MDGGANVGRATARHGAKFSKNPVNCFFVGLVETHFFSQEVFVDFTVFPCKVLESRSPNNGDVVFFFFKMKDLLGVGLSPRFEA